MTIFTARRGRRAAIGATIIAAAALLLSACTPPSTSSSTSTSTAGGDAVSASGCGVLANVKWYWSPKSYFEERDAEMTGTVTVGQLQQLTAKGDYTAPTPQKQK